MLKTFPDSKICWQEYFGKWGDTGIVDLKDELSDLIILTASRTLLGMMPPSLDHCIRLSQDITTMPIKRASMKVKTGLLLDSTPLGMIMRMNSGSTIAQCLSWLSTWTTQGLSCRA